MLIAFYTEHILPHLIAISCGAAPVMCQRQKLVPRAEGRVLEIGFGSGLNTSFYETKKVSEVLGLEPSKGMRRKAQKAINEASIPIQLIDYVDEEIPVDPGSIDTVVTTYTLCTIRDYSPVLSQIRRVLKPEGRLLFCEHGRAPDANVLSWQNRLNSFWKVVAGGCNLNRPIPTLITNAGFNILDLNMMYLAKTPRFAGYNYWGSAAPR